MRYIFLFFISVLLVSCNPIDQSFPLSTPVTLTTLSPDVQEPLRETISGNHEEYYPIFETGLGTKIIKAVHKTGQQTKISFINSRAKSMEITITFPEKNANLRFSQIVMPDGTMDGPFGQHVGYNLKQFGGYTLIFNENQMAGEPWSGEADISVTLHESTYDDDVVLLP